MQIITSLNNRLTQKTVSLTRIHTNVTITLNNVIRTGDVVGGSIVFTVSSGGISGWETVAALDGVLIYDSNVVVHDDSMRKQTTNCYINGDIVLPDGLSAGTYIITFMSIVKAL